MKYLIPLSFICFLLFIACGSEDDLGQYQFKDNPDLTDGLNLVKMKVDGVDRQFGFHVPINFDETKQLPVVFAFHGAGRGPFHFWETSGWRELADRDQFIVVYPAALISVDKRSDKQIRAWNFGGSYMKKVIGDIRHDDIGYVEGILKYVKHRFNVASDKIYACGFSLGGNFVCRLTKEMADEFSAIGCSSGIYSDDKTKPSRPLSFMLLGGKQELIDRQGYIDNKADKDILELPIIKDAIQKILLDHDLKDEYSYVDMGNYSVFKYDQPNGDHTATFEFAFVDGLRHRFPTSINNPHKIKGAELFWEFFQRSQN